MSAAATLNEAGTVFRCSEDLGQCEGVVAEDAGSDPDPAACQTQLSCDDACVNDTCVECAAYEDCTAPEASHCELDDPGTFVCLPCTDDEHCAHIAGMGICNAGACVECTAADEAACEANSCNPATDTCTTTPRDSVRTCGACVADSECDGDDARCVPLEFQGAPQGGYCINLKAAGCSRPFTVTVTSDSLSGAGEAEYCGIDESATTCPAVLALVDAASCPGGDDAECADAGGQCGTVGGVANQCTIPCGDALQCTGGRTCPSAYCE